MRSPRSWIAGILFLIAAAVPLQGQYFGKNQVQYERFDWQIIETEHFLVHYYPEIRQAAMTAASMAERSYARLSRIMGHQFREKKPLILFSSRGHFGQNHVTGDLGEGTGGVTEALRHRVLVPFTGDFHSFERVLTHELVHSFQYDIFAAGRAGAGLGTLQAFSPPLWFIEGMAEYLALGPSHPMTDAWIFDAAVHGRLPTMEQLENPNDFFPYRFGESVMAYIGAKWGDDAIGRLMQAVPSGGLRRAVQRELGIPLDELGEEWQEEMQTRYLPQLPERDRPRKFAQPMLNTKLSGGAQNLFLAPSLSPDGKYVAFFSTGSVARGEVFIDLWLADAKTGKRLAKLVESTLDPNFEELRLLYSQSAFSPDGSLLAFTAQRQGQDVLYLLDVAKRKTVRRFELPGLDGVTGPAFSPDGTQLVVSGTFGGISDLYMVNVDGTGFTRLTNDPYGDLQPQWSPDGTRIAFASERGPGTDLNVLRFDDWKISVLDIATKQVEILPGQAGLNINPTWAPDSKSLAFVSDRTGTANIFLYDFTAAEHYQLTNVVGSISAITEFSPAITWARGSDVLAFAYFDDGDYTIWSTSNPRSLKGQPFRVVVADNAPASGAGGAASAVGGAVAAAQDSSGRLPRPTDTSVRDSTVTSQYRGNGVLRDAGDLPVGATDRPLVSVAALLDSAAVALPDTNRFRDYAYQGTLEPEYLTRPSIGYEQDSFGQNVYGQSVLVLSDMLGDQQLALAGGLNGRVSEARFYGHYANLSRRLQYRVGMSQEPYFYYSGTGLYDLGGGIGLEEQRLTRYIWRQIFSVGAYPFSRFSRLEVGLNYNHVDRANMILAREVDFNRQLVGSYYIDRIESEPGVSYIQPMTAYVYDNALYGYSGPIMGTLLRAEIQPAIGGLRWISYMVDARRYEPVIFNFLTIAARLNGRIAVGRDEDVIPSYIGRPELLRGYNREAFSSGCQYTDIGNSACGAARLIGSRVAVASAEVRFPVIRALSLGLLPISLPPVDGLVFYDVGMAWSSGDPTSFTAPTDEAQRAITRYPLRSYGYGVRLNLYGLALLRWDYAIPLDLGARKGFWTFSIGPSF